GRRRRIRASSLLSIRSIRPSRRSIRPSRRANPASMPDSSLDSTRARSSRSAFFDRVIHIAVEVPATLTTTPMTAIRRSTRLTIGADLLARGYQRPVSGRPDESPVAGRPAEGDELFHGQGDLAGVEAGPGGQLVGVGRFAGQGLE